MLPVRELVAMPTIFCPISITQGLSIALEDKIWKIKFLWEKKRGGE